MKGRTDEAIANTIDAMKRVIKSMYPNDELEFVDNFTVTSPKDNIRVDEDLNMSLVYLGKAIQKMAKCDTMAKVESGVLWRSDTQYSGCNVEEHVAREYGLYIIELNDVDGSIYFPDLKERFERRCKEDCCCDKKS